MQMADKTFIQAVARKAKLQIRKKAEEKGRKLLLSLLGWAVTVALVYLLTELLPWTKNWLMGLRGAIAAIVGSGVVFAYYFLWTAPKELWEQERKRADDLEKTVAAYPNLEFELDKIQVQERPKQHLTLLTVLNSGGGPGYVRISITDAHVKTESEDEKLPTKLRLMRGMRLPKFGTQTPECRLDPGEQADFELFKSGSANPLRPSFLARCAEIDIERMDLRYKGFTTGLAPTVNPEDLGFQFTPGEYAFTLLTSTGKGKGKRLEVHVKLDSEDNFECTSRRSESA